MIIDTDVAACILSGIAIIASIYACNRSNEVSKKITEKTLNENFFKEIFFEDIIVKIPRCLSKIKYEEHNAAIECNKLDEIIFEILDKIIFYKYFDNGFYIEIRDILIEMDEKLVIASEDELSKPQFEYYFNKIEELVNSFYSKLKKYYSII